MRLYRHLFQLFWGTCIGLSAFAQTNWQDDFNDTNFSQNPKWLGDTNIFRVNQQQQLQLDAPAITGMAQLATASSASLKATWQFYVRLDFNPSSNNYSAVYLMSNSDNLNLTTAGYLLQIGGNTADRISLFRKNGALTTLIAESADGLVNSSVVEMNVRVTRDSLFNWTVLVDTTLTNTYVPIASGTDGFWKNSAYFGVQCTYTSTRSDKFFFDDFVVTGELFSDDTPPAILGLAYAAADRLTLTFSEPVDSATAASVQHYYLPNPLINPQQVIWRASQPAQVELVFATPFSNNTSYYLKVEEIADLFGNEMNDTTVVFNFYRPDYRAVVINEIMADPEPAVGLPAAEYLEIFNTTQKDIGIGHWKLVLDEDTFALSTDTIGPGSYQLIVSTANASLFSGLPHLALPLGSNWLRNSKKAILLLDETNLLIDALFYSTDWYQNTAKATGGWSLEQIRGDLPCSEPTNWSASNSSTGGTPAQANMPEGNPKNDINAIKAVYWQAENELALRFTKALQPGQLPVILTSLGQPELTFNPISPNFIRLRFNQNLPATKIEIILAQGSSCGSAMLQDTLYVGAPQSLEPGDVVLNELLFNPKPEDTDFIELWNTTDKTLFLDDIRLAATDENGTISTVFSAGDPNMLLLPKVYLVLSTDEDAICGDYTCGKPRNFFETALPSMPDDEGGVVLIRPNLDVLESVWYSEDWHHQLISNPEGVSLERVSPNLPSAEALSWHSAAASAGFATPGKLNSQFNSATAGKARFALNTETFSPNNDGFNDVLIVSYDLPQGAVLTAQVFSLQGIPIKILAENELAAPSGQLVWHGTTDENSVAASGIYVILATWFTPNGETGKSKLTVALSQ